jgi:CheY-like chemotaxis protein
MLRRIIGDDIVVELRHEATEATLFADPVQLHQVLLNLAVNARDAMPSGGRLIVGVSNVVIDEATANLQPEQRVGDYVVLTVADNGVGMSHDVRERLFEPFFTTKPAGRGTGLGLSTVYGIVKQHGGHIAVYSELGQGTTFRIFFPVSHAPANEPRLTLPPVQPQLGTERLLVVDDNDSIRRFLSDGLTRLGYVVVTARHGQEALDILSKSDTVPFALVLSDIVMPVMNGCELVDRLSVTHPTLPVVLMSGFVDEQIVTSSPRVRSTVMLQKPISLLELSQTLRRVLRERAAPPGVR